MENRGHRRWVWLMNSFALMPSAKSATGRSVQCSSGMCGRFSTGADQSDLPHQTERRELIARLAPIVKRLALSPDELAQLPDTYVRALQNHEFPAAYDPANPSQAFLPPDLFDTRGPWVCLGAPDHDLAAPLHALSFTARSIFFVFARLPGGRAATLAYFKQLAEMKLPLFVRMQEPGWPQPMDVWNPKVPQFPVGTEFALVRKLVLPDRDGH